LTELGGWGTWVNGGAWLIIGGQRVDWLYRNLDVVRATLDACNTHGMRNELIEELPLI
jgi:hypothetical protein